MAEKPTCNLWLAQFALGQFGFIPHGQLKLGVQDRENAYVGYCAVSARLSLGRGIKPTIPVLSDLADFSGRIHHPYQQKGCLIL